MPIIWKTAFEEPLIKLIQTGAIGNSVQLAGAIALQYDLAVKQGLPNPPGAPAGPAIGKPPVLQAALIAYFTSEAVKSQAGVIKVYIDSLKSVYKLIKDNSKNIKNTTKEISKIKRERATIKNNIKKLSNKVNTKNPKDAIPVKKEIIQEKQKDAKLLFKLKDFTAALKKFKDAIVQKIKPIIKSVLQKLKALIIRIQAPPLQDTSLKSLAALPLIIKDTIKDVVKKRKEYIGKAKDNVKQIKEKSNKLKELPKLVDKEDQGKVKEYVKGVVTGFDTKKTAANGNKLISVFSKYPTTKVPLETKNDIKRNVTDIIKLKSETNLYKQKAVEFVKQKLKSRKDSLVSTFTPKIKPRIPKALEARKDAKELKDKLTEYKGVIKQKTEVVTTLTQLKAESKNIKSKYDELDLKGQTSNIKEKARSVKGNKGSDLKKYVPNPRLGSALEKYKPGLGEKYNGIQTLDQARNFILVSSNTVLADKTVLENKKQMVKKGIQGIKDKIKRKKLNPKEIIFNSYLRSGIIGYWAGAICPNLGVVTFPGTLTVPAEMKPSADPGAFIISLSKALQAHIKTVAGTYTIPGTPPVVLPWVGYT